MTLDVQRQSKVQLASSWTALNPEERKRRAVQAARDRNLEILWELEQAWLTLYSSARKNISKHTLKAYKTALKQWLIGTSDQSLLQVDSDAARLWIERLEIAPNSSQVKIAGVKAFYAALRWAGATQADPLKDVKPERDNTSKNEKRDRYTDAEIEALLAVKTDDPRDQVLVLLAGHAGLRVSECCLVGPSNYNPKTKSLKFVGKGRKTRTVQVSRRLATLLGQVSPIGETYLGFGDDWARIKMQKLCALAGVTYRAVHSLRHSAGSRLYQQTTDLMMVAEHLGHSSIETTQIYAKWDKTQLEVAVQDW